jgi:hypothetical protein
MFQITFDKPISTKEDMGFIQRKAWFEGVL